MAIASLNPVEVPPSIITSAKWNKITLIGEAAGANEAAWCVCAQCGSGAAFPGPCKFSGCSGIRSRSPQGWVGPAGNMLRLICKNAGINFDLCNRSNVVKRKPSSNDFGVFYLDKARKQPTQELLYWQSFLLKELITYRPNIAVALGNEALKALTDKDGITKYAGSILTSDKIPNLKVIPVMHPAYIMRDNWEEYYVAIRIFRKVLAESKAPQRLLQSSERDQFILNPSLPDVLNFIELIRTSPECWYLDVETRGDTLQCFGLSSSSKPGLAICIPIQKTTGPAWSVKEEAQIWRALSLAADSNKLFRNQNCVYDIDYLLDYRVEPGGIDFDPMIGMNVAFPEFPKGLDFQTSLFTNREYYKDEGKTWKKKTPDQLVYAYNCKDMVTTPETSEAIIKELKDAKIFEIARNRSIKFLPLAIEMQRNRLLLDENWYGKLAGLLEGERVLIHSELTSEIGSEINVKSSQQVQQLLYEQLRLPVKYKRGTRTPTVDENSLKELRAELGNNRILELILTERHLRTKESNYINVSFDEDSNGERYLAYQTNIGGTKTGRWSYSQSPKWRGSSPQVIPKVIRLMYKPPNGSCFWQRDLSQAEARVVAWLSNCKFLLNTFASPIKIHKVVGGAIFNKPPNEILDDSMEYDVSKRVVHGYDYMMHWKKIAIIANTPYDFTRRAYEAYGLQVPEITAWHRSTAQTVLKTGRLVTPMGRVRQCYKACSALVHTGSLPDEILRDLVSWIPQSTVPDVLNESMFELWNELDWVSWHQQGHDSFLASGPPSRTQEFFERSEAAAEKVHFVINDRDCYIPGEFQWGFSWGGMLKYKAGEVTTYDAWRERAEAEGFFDEAKIRKKLISLL